VTGQELSSERFGSAARELAAGIAAGGYLPDLFLAIARGGLYVAGALAYALDVKNVHLTNVELVRDFCAEHVAEARCGAVYQKPHATVECEYVWRRTERWIDFPWSAPNLPRLLP
jgi:uncharacterized protein